MRLSLAALSSAVLSLSSIVLAATPASLRLVSPQVAVVSSEGSTLVSHILEQPKSLAEPVTLPPLSTFTLSFQVVDGESGEAVVPHQAHLGFFDIETGLDTVLPLIVRANGKARFKIDTASPPTALLTSSGSFNIQLYVGSLTASKPISYPLLTLTLPSAILRPAVSQPAAHDLLTSFTKQPLISHTFRPEEKAVNPVLSLAGTAIVLAPWLVLVALVGNLGLKYTAVPISYPFLLMLVALEASIAVYWIGYIRLFKFLIIFGVLSVAAFFTGRAALAHGGVPK